MSTTANQSAKGQLEPNLITRAQNGDADAFAALFEAHKQRIYAICLRMTNNIAEAEDLTQDAFMHVFRKLSTFRGDSAFSTWLYRIAVNTVLMHFRRNCRRHVSLDQPAQESMGAKREPGCLDARLSGCIDRLALLRALQELPPGYRMMFLLHEVEGFEHKEIAQLLNCSIGNSKSQLHKAKLKMRELLLPRSISQIISAAGKESQVASDETFVATVAVTDGERLLAGNSAAESLRNGRISPDKEKAPVFVPRRSTKVAQPVYRRQLTGNVKPTNQATAEEREMSMPAIPGASPL